MGDIKPHPTNHTPLDATQPYPSVANQSTAAAAVVSPVPQAQADHSVPTNPLGGASQPQVHMSDVSLPALNVRSSEDQNLQNCNLSGLFATHYLSKMSQCKLRQHCVSTLKWVLTEIRIDGWILEKLIDISNGNANPQRAVYKPIGLVTSPKAALPILAKLQDHPVIQSALSHSYVIATAYSQLPCDFLTRAEDNSIFRSGPKNTATFVKNLRAAYGNAALLHVLREHDAAPPIIWSMVKTDDHGAEVTWSWSALIAAAPVDCRNNTFEGTCALMAWLTTGVVHRINVNWYNFASGFAKPLSVIVDLADTGVSVVASCSKSSNQHGVQMGTTGLPIVRRQRVENLLPEPDHAPTKRPRRNVRSVYGCAFVLWAYIWLFIGIGKFPA